MKTIKSNIYLVLLLLSIVIISGCTTTTTQKETCRTPYIEYKVGECCLDSNTNNICDSDETITTDEKESLDEPVDDDKNIEVKEPEEEPITCIDECDFPGKECIYSEFYYCMDSDGDGCLERHMFDAAYTDCKCNENNECIGPDYKYLSFHDSEQIIIDETCTEVGSGYNAIYGGYTAYKCPKD